MKPAHAPPWRTTPLVALLVAPLVALLASASPSNQAQAQCDPATVATPVARRRAESGTASIWPLDAEGAPIFRPASDIPGERDSTSHDTRTLPNHASGLELFQDVAAVGERDERSEGVWPEIFTAYNSGLTAWDTTRGGGTLRQTDLHDGYERDRWMRLIVRSEQDFYINAVDALPIGATTTVVATTGRDDFGNALWTYDRDSGQLTQLYHDGDHGGEDVRLIEAPDGGRYALIGAPGGVLVYDVDAALAGAPCLDDPGTPGSDCPGVVTGSVGTMNSGRYVDAVVHEGRLFVVASNGALGGARLVFDIWEVRDLGQPSGTALRRFSASTSSGTAADQVHALRLFVYRGRPYLAFVQDLRVRVHDLGECLSPLGCLSLGPPIATEALADPRAARFRLDATFSNGDPYLHYGAGVLGTFGEGFEHLWALEGVSEGLARPTLPEVTDGGATYTDPCNGETVGYFGDYFPGNPSYGLNRFIPGHAIFSGDLLFRTSNTVFDVHQLVQPVGSPRQAALPGGGS